MWMFGVCCLRKPPAPVMVPPVPIPEHEGVDAAAGVVPDFGACGGARGWRGWRGSRIAAGSRRRGSRAASSSALGDGPFHPFCGFRQLHCGRRGSRTILRRSIDMLSGMVQDQLVAFGGGWPAPGRCLCCPDVGSIRVVLPGVMVPAAFHRLDHGDARCGL